MRKLTTLAFLCVSLATPLLGQEYLDRGTFVLKRGDAETGRVEFAVRATTGQRGDGGLLIIGTTRTPAHEVQYILEVSRDQAPVSYQMTDLLIPGLLGLKSITINKSASQLITQNAFAAGCGS